MSSKKLRVPQLVLHKPSGRGVVFLRGAQGRARAVYCGPWGSAAAERRYREVLAEHLAGKSVEAIVAPEVSSASSSPVVAELCAAYLLHAQRYYVDVDGRPTGEVTHATYVGSPGTELEFAL